MGHVLSSFRSPRDISYDSTRLVNECTVPLDRAIELAVRYLIILPVANIMPAGMHSLPIISSKNNELGRRIWGLIYGVV